MATLPRWRRAEGSGSAPDGAEVTIRAGVLARGLPQLCEQYVFESHSLCEVHCRTALERAFEPLRQVLPTCGKQLLQPCRGLGRNARA